MKTLLANLAAKSDPEEQLTAFKRWLFLRGDALRYALAPAVVAIAFLARLALTPILGDASPYLLFVPAVLVAGRLGGLGDCWQPASASYSASSSSRCLLAFRRRKSSMLLCSR